MSLTTRLQALATRIADEFKAIRVSLTTGVLKATRIVAGSTTDNGVDALQVGGNIVFSEGGAEIKLAVDVLGMKPHFWLQTSENAWAAVQPSFAQKAIAMAKAVGGNTTLSVMGCAITATGTATAATTAATNVHTTTRRLEYAVTTAAATAVAGFRASARNWYRGGPSNPYGGFFLQCKFGPSRGATLATRRNFVGMCISTTAPTDVEPTYTDILGVGTRAADTNWQIMHRNGSGTIQYIDTGMAKSVTDNSEMYQLFLFAHPDISGVAYEFIRLSDGAAVSGVMPEATVPARSTLLNFQAYSSVGETSSVIGISLADLYIESDF